MVPDSAEHATVRSAVRRLKKAVPYRKSIGVQFVPLRKALKIIVAGRHIMARETVTADHLLAYPIAVRRRNVTTVLDGRDCALIDGFPDVESAIPDSFRTCARVSIPGLLTLLYKTSTAKVDLFFCVDRQVVEVCNSWCVEAVVDGKSGILTFYREELLRVLASFAAHRVIFELGEQMQLRVLRPENNTDTLIIVMPIR